MKTNVHVKYTVKEQTKMTSNILLFIIIDSINEVMMKTLYILAYILKSIMTGKVLCRLIYRLKIR